MTRSEGPSIHRRAALTPALLTVGFYAAVVVLSMVLVALPFVVSCLEWDDGSLSWALRRVGKWSVPMAGAVLVAAWPRKDRYRPRGFLVREGTQPRLFAAIREVAEAGQAEMPDEVYLTNDMNACVLHAGGRLGLGDRRILMVGLPLLQLLTPKEAAAVLAHEFGHFVGGHARAGAWAYRVRASMARVASRTDALGDVLSCLFQAYARLFLRATRTLSRQQEMEADAFAARVVDPGSLASALRKVGPGSRALAAYLNAEFLPVVEQGRRPPFLAGFAEFLGTRWEGLRASRAPDRDGPQDPYDSHPPLADRLARLGSPTSAAVGETGDMHLSAIRWIVGLDEAERQALPWSLRRGNLTQLQSVAWADVGTELAVPRMREVRHRLPRGLLADVRLADLVDQTPRLHAIGEQILRQAGGSADDASDQERVALAKAMLADATLATLAEAGWQVRRRIGIAYVAVSGSAELSPHAAWGGRAAAATWREACAKHGVGALSLLPAAAPGRLAESDPGRPEPVGAGQGGGTGARATADRRADARRVRRPARGPSRTRLAAARTRWRALAVGLVVAAASLLAALGVRWASAEADPDLSAWQAESESFRRAWHAGDLAAIEVDCDPTRRVRLMGWLRGAIERRGWQGKPPVLPEPRVTSTSGDAVLADYALPVGVMETKWVWREARWWLEAIVLPTRW